MNRPFPWSPVSRWTAPLLLAAATVACERASSPLSEGGFTRDGSAAGGTDGGVASGTGGGAGSGTDGGGGAPGTGLDDGAEKIGIPIVPLVDVSPAPTCVGGSTSGCLYRPPTYGPVTMNTYEDDVSYTDLIGRQRRVEIAVYRADSAPLPAPVVLMSHGGANGITVPDKVLREWASLVASAGYVVVTMAHADYVGADYDAMCAAVGVVPATGFMCALKINWARPLDIAAVLGWLKEKVATDPRWAQRLDLSRLAHFGHSAGAGAAMMVGGIPRNFVCSQPFGYAQGSIVPCLLSDLVDRRLTDIKAIVALSPQGPGSDGFMTESFPQLQVPMLMASGLNDGDPGEPANRLEVFDLIPPGQRWKFYLDDPGAKHGFFGGNLDPCATEDTLARCSEMRAWLTATIHAFLDAELRGNADAMAWLNSNDLAALSATTATLSAK